MSFPTDGVYTIRNVDRNLNLDLKDNNTEEGNVIQGFKIAQKPNPTPIAQQWIVRTQKQRGSGNKTVSIQSNNDDRHGNGFFTAKNQDEGEPVVYTRKAWLVDLENGANNVFTIHFTRESKQLVLSIPSKGDPTVKLENYTAATARQQWEFNKFSDI